ncbi:hypothetical protein P691DRAFT_544640 [Macrolepiota fuliginosa MF-IS2]|uniref:Uncharacterized protein n=1 Tax=Macrolepiota fuliginosa MF-IS2 TaxID=1400762 RepID=A0A9P6BXQ3_9AGAR|nr:hypothetical protein P691DRAFT_544640 [Macrolepiota fuliginosa MF-IS2]
MTGIGAPALISQKVVPQSIGTIVGGAIGGALALILLFVSVFFCIRRRQRVRTLAKRLLPSHSTIVTLLPRAPGGSNQSAKSRMRRTQDAAEPLPYTAEESLMGVTLSSRT